MANSMQLRDIDTIISPSLNNDPAKLGRLLQYGYRAYYAYSSILSYGISYILNGHYALNPFAMVILFMIQAGLLFYVFQTLRRFFAVSPTIKQSITLRISYFTYLLTFLFFNIILIILGPLSSNISRGFSFSVTLFSLLIGIIGDLFLKKLLKNHSSLPSE